MPRHALPRCPASVKSAVLIIVASLGLGGVAWASHNFIDVPTGAFYHDAVEWIVNRSITAGCAAGLYCPLDPVNRAQMAVFMQRLGGVFTPFFLEATQSPGALDPDLQPTVCQTAGYSVAAYPRTAIIDGQFAASGAGTMGFQMIDVFSTDGGTTWTPVNTFAQGQQAKFSGDIVSASAHARLDLAVNSTYRFGIRISRWNGTADFATSACEMYVQIMNRNGTSTPLVPERP